LFCSFLHAVTGLAGLAESHFCKPQYASHHVALTAHRRDHWTACVSHLRCRHKALASYKAQRGPAPDGFSADLRNLQLLLSFMRVHTISVPGYEADDVLAGTAAQAAAAGYSVRIYSSDMDLWQV
jgi:DNA polymerase-1